MQKYFVDLWNGDKSLLQTFWIWNALSWAVINNLSRYIFDAYATPENFKILAWALMLTQIIYFILQLSVYGPVVQKLIKMHLVGQRFGIP